MGFVSEAQCRAIIPFLADEDSLETGEVGWYGNLYKTAAQQTVLVEVEVVRGRRTVVEKRARYAEDIPVEFAYWVRHFDRDHLGHDHFWSRQECHAKHPAIAKGDALIVAEFPFEGRQRYKPTTFRPALTSDHKPFFTKKFISRLAEAREQRRTDLTTLALELLEDASVLPRDPFNTGQQRVAAISLPPAPFHEDLGDYGRRIGLDEEAFNGLALGTCRNPEEVRSALEIELYEIIGEQAAAQARSEGRPADGELRFATPPRGSKQGRRRLTDDVPSLVNELVPHAAWLAMAGPEPHEVMPSDRSVARVAFRRLNDLLFNFQKRVDRMNANHASPVEEWER